MTTFRRCERVVFVNDEMFDVSDLLSLYPGYDHHTHSAHFYDGEQHYVSDGSNQIGLPVPYGMAEELSLRMPELRMCRSQRENDNRYFENLRNERR